MTGLAVPEARLSHLPHADGSATYAYAGYIITASANGPIEAQRRDEDPYEALVDVVVRPVAGVGATRERHLESILQSALRQLILVKNFPRCLIQIVLQIRKAPENDYVNTKLVQPSLNLAMVPALVQAAVLALLSAALPLRATAAATVIAFLQGGGDEAIIIDPSPRQLEEAESVHVFTFTSGGELLLAESEGNFIMNHWDLANATAQRICNSSAKPSAESQMVLDAEPDEGPQLQQFLRSTLQNKVSRDIHWK